MAERTGVAIVGAGPAGLAVGACLRLSGLDFVMFEQAPQIAPSWRRHYERLHLHTIKQLSSLPHLPFPAAYPRYVPRHLFVEYLESYAAAFDLEPRLGETVQAIHRTGGGWTVESTSGAIDAAHVVIASGFNAEPVMPTVPGRGSFKGKALHSADYRNARPFAGQSVLVVGMGNTGAEIALDLSEHGARPTLSLRDGVHIAPRDLFGIPIQVAATLATRVLPTSVNDAIFPAILDLALGYPSRHGLRRPNEGILRRIEKSAKIPVLDVGTVRKIAEGAIKVAPGLTRITEEGVVFDDGQAGRYDAIVFATGFRPNYSSFLDPALHEGGEPTLHFVGFKNPVTGLLREIAREARRAADLIARDQKENGRP